MATLSQVSLRQLIIIGRKKEIGRREVFHLISSLTDASLALKRSRGFSHGNLNAANVFVRDPRRISASDVVLQHSKPVESSDAPQNELSDLHNLGDILFKLVRHRDASAAESWPVPDGPEWTEMFGKDAEAWRNLCNRLVDPNLSLADVSLEDLQTQLKELQPRAVRGRSTIAIAAVVLVVVVAVCLIFWIRGLQAAKYVVLKVDSTPAGARIKLDGIERPETTPAALQILRTDIRKDGRMELALSLNNHSTAFTNFATTGLRQVDLGKMPLQHHIGTVEISSDPAGAEIFHVVDGRTVSLGRTPSTHRLDTGDHTIVARSPFLGEKSLPIAIEKDQRQSLAFDFEYGTLVVEVESPASGATVWLDTQSLGPSPYTNITWPAGTTSLTIRADRFNDEPVTVSVTNRQVTLLRGVRLSEGQGAVEITGLPPGTEVFDTRTNRLGAADATGRFSARRPVGTDNFMVRKDWRYHRLPEIRVAKDQTTTVARPVRFGRLILQSEPPGAEILRDGVRLTDAGDKPFLTPFTNDFHDPGAAFVYSLRKKQGEDDEWSGQEEIAMTGSEVIRLVKLSSGSGYVRFVPNPPTLSLFWKTETGQQPITSALWRFPKGPREIVAQHGELGRVTNSVNVVAGQTNEFRVRIPHGSVVLDGEPRNVQAYRTNASGLTLSSLTPWSEQFVKPGQVLYTLQDTNRHFLPATLPTNITDGVTHEIRYQLQRGSATLNLRGPSGTEVWVLTNPPAAAQVFPQHPPLGRLGPNSVLEARLPAGFTYSLVASNQGKLWTNAITLPPKIGDEIPLAISFPDTVMQVAANVPIVPQPVVMPPGGEQRTKQIELPGGVGMEFVWVETAGLHVGRYEVTQKQYQSVMSNKHNPSKFPGDDLPVNNITLGDALQFCAALTEQHPTAGHFRLPTTDEWRAFAGDVARLTADKMPVFGIYNKGEAAGPVRVGSLQANRYGLFDLRGNVSELCTDGNSVWAVGHGYKDRNLPGPNPVVARGIVPAETVINPNNPVEWYGFRVVLAPRGQ